MNIPCSRPDGLPSSTPPRAVLACRLVLPVPDLTPLERTALLQATRLAATLQLGRTLAPFDRDAPLPHDASSFARWVEAQLSRPLGRVARPALAWGLVCAALAQHQRADPFLELEAARAKMMGALALTGSRPEGRRIPAGRTARARRSTRMADRADG